MAQRSLTILGSTGSIGTQALDVVRFHAGELRVEALSAGANAELLVAQAREFRPRIVHLADADRAAFVRERLADLGIAVLTGPDGLVELAASVPADLVVVATVGWTGVEPTLAALQAGRDVALANKEVLVCAGTLVLDTARRRGATIWPLDSEHNAIMQALAAGPADAPLRRVILTCSGGAFRDLPAHEVENAGPERTLAHPTWDMGRKITIDSATLMNKGFEVIEAHHLFDLPLDRIEVVVHPQSIVHSIVEFVDGSMIAQMGAVDMRLPIQNVLTRPHRRPTPVAPLDLARVGVLEFREPDLDRFPCLAMAYRAAEVGGTIPCILNAANEVAVQAHLDGRLPYGGIARLLAAVLERHDRQEADSLDTLRRADAAARRTAAQLLDAAMVATPAPHTLQGT
ncbi:MAG: 1-deoxy-D-xylulose-5-phosphate reductoisomerase [Candidatus Sumerlaeia bacterium]|nr:1-deoxy-D-xylulose-5-phosphate reductoisomerase [Candidatus Sumerlaeia bacterium]